MSNHGRGKGILSQEKLKDVEYYSEPFPGVRITVAGGGDEKCVKQRHLRSVLVRFHGDPGQSQVILAKESHTTVLTMSLSHNMISCARLRFFSFSAIQIQSYPA